MPKSNNIFAIRVNPISLVRDNAISELTGEERISPLGVFIGSNNSFKNSYITKKIAYIKTWKTSRGASSYLEKLINYKKLFPSNDFGYYTDSEIKNDPLFWKNCTYSVDEIKVEWNTHIDDQIKMEKERHENMLKKLESKKIQSKLAKKYKYEDNF